MVNTSELITGPNNDTWQALRDECGERVSARFVANASHALLELILCVSKVVMDWVEGLDKRNE